MTLSEWMALSHHLNKGEMTCGTCKNYVRTSSAKSVSPLASFSLSGWRPELRRTATSRGESDQSGIHARAHMLIFVAAVVVAWGWRALLPSTRLAKGKVRWVWMPIGAVLLQVGLTIGALRGFVGDGRIEVVLFSYVVVGAWLVGNAYLQPSPLRLSAGLIAGGWALNFVPIVTNRGMPVSAAALARLGVHNANIADGNLWKHILATPHTVVPWLGDIIPVPIPILRNVISVGDIATLVGIVLFVHRLDVAGQPARHEPSNPAVPALTPP